MAEQKQIKEEAKEQASGQKQGKKPSVPACCIGCVRWEKFGKSCWYYWEGKKHCTMWTGSWEDMLMQ